MQTETVVLTQGGIYIKDGITFKQGIPTEIDKPLADRLLGAGRFVLAKEATPKQLGAEQTSDGLFLTASGDAVKVSVNEIGNLDLANKRILLKRNGAIGDVVFVATIADYLKRKFPSCSIVLSVRENLVEFCEGFDCLDSAITLDAASKVDLISTFDVILHFNDVIESRKKDDADYFKLHFERAGILDDVPAKFYPLSVSKLGKASTVKNDADAILQSCGIGAEPYVAVVLGSSNPLKQIHVRNLEEIVNGVATASRDKSRSRLRVLCIGSLDDRIPDNLAQWVSIANTQPLPVSAELIRRASVVFGSDTGLVQFGAAIGRPTVSYWGPTSSTFSIEHYAGNFAAIQPTIDCSPCMVLKTAFCKYYKDNSPDCMKGIDSKNIVDQISNAFRNPPKIDTSGPVYSEGILRKADVGSKLLRTRFNIALLLDNAHTYTGGGFYTWTLAKVLSGRFSCDVWLFVDTITPIYDIDDTRPHNLHVVYDEDLKQACWNPLGKFDLVIGTPPALGPATIEGAKKCGAQSAVILYETPNYIAEYRQGLDTEDAYWDSYKQAAVDANFVIAISKTVKRKAYQWLPILKQGISRVYTIPPYIRSDVANEVLPPLAKRISAKHRTDSIVIISRNMAYKEIASAIAAISKIKRKIMIHVIGSDTNKLYKSLEQLLENSLTSITCHEEITERKKWELIGEAKALVHPSIFEGFGIPVAEAMYACVPVIAHKLEVFQDQFEDHPFYYSTDRELRDVVRAMFTGWKRDDGATLHKFIQKAYTHVNKKYTLGVGKLSIGHLMRQKFKDTLVQIEQSAIDNTTLVSRDLRVAIVSTWNTKCGIAETTRDWVDNLNCTYKIFAPQEPAQAFLADDDNRVLRCWNREFASYTELIQPIIEFAPNIVHIEHEYSFFKNEKMFFGFIKDLRERGIKVVITIHTYMPSGLVDRLADAVDKVIVTKEQGDVANNPRYTSIGLPVPHVQRIGEDEARQRLGWTDRPRFIVGSFGMWNPHKGFDEFLDTYNDIAIRCNGSLRYVLIGYRDSGNQYAQATFRKHSDKMQDERVITFQNYEPLEAVVHKLCTANVLVFNYSIVGHSSASAAMRTGMIAGRPIVCTHSPMFSEFEHEKHVLKVSFGDQSELIQAIMRLREDRGLARDLVANCDTFLGANTCEVITRKHEALYKELT